MAPNLIARAPTNPKNGARFDLLFDPEHVKLGRQMELDSLRRRRVVEKVSSGLEGIRLQAGLTEDYKKYPLCQGRLAVLQLVYGARDDVTESRDVCCGTSGKGGW